MFNLPQILENTPAQSTAHIYELIGSRSKYCGNFFYTLPEDRPNMQLMHDRGGFCRKALFSDIPRGFKRAQIGRLCNHIQKSTFGRCYITVYFATAASRNRHSNVFVSWLVYACRNFIYRVAMRAIETGLIVSACCKPLLQNFKKNFFFVTLKQSEKSLKNSAFLTKKISVCTTI